MRRRLITVGLLAVLVGALCSSASGRESAAGPEALARAVTPQGLRAHLGAFAAIARRNGGTRVTGSRGYEASVAYVAGQLRRAGYRPRLQRFTFDLWRETSPPTFAGVGGATYRRNRDFVTMQYSGSGNVAAQVAAVQPSSDSSGCDRAAFAGFPRGAVALVRRGTCFMAEKARNAKAAGASAVLIANDGAPGRTAPILGTLIRPGIGIPVLGISSSLGSELAGSPASVRIRVTAVSRRARAANVVADLPGRRGGAVLLGAHLDSVANGPGINDNASGSAVVLEVARQARRLGVRPARGLRFAFWGAEELGLVGSSTYVDSLGERQRTQLAGVLNLDMVGSSNFARLVYDGDAAPPGSTRIEQLLRSHFAARRLPLEEIALQGSSDHAPFARAGIPVGGLFTGADALKRPELAQRFGGQPGQPLDPCYHRDCDTLANVNLRVLSQMADAAAVVAVRLAG